MPYVPLPGDARFVGKRRFFGEIREMTAGSEGEAIEADVEVNAILSAETASSKLPLQSPDVAAKGDGRGVISTSGPKPGEEYTEPGESDPIFCRAADKAERTLELRTGRPVVTEACWRVSSFNGTGIAELSGRAAERDLVRNRSPALRGVCDGGGAIVGCVCGGAVSRTWMDALYSNAGCEARKSRVVVDRRSSDAWPE